MLDPLNFVEMFPSFIPMDIFSNIMLYHSIRERKEQVAIWLYLPVEALIFSVRGQFVHSLAEPVSWCKRLHNVSA